jgi:hypothetical protein
LQEGVINVMWKLKSRVKKDIIIEEKLQVREVKKDVKYLNVKANGPRGRKKYVVDVIREIKVTRLLVKFGLNKDECVWRKTRDSRWFSCGDDMIVEVIMKGDKYKIKYNENIIDLKCINE